MKHDLGFITFSIYPEAKRNCFVGVWFNKHVTVFTWLNLRTIKAIILNVFCATFWDCDGESSFEQITDRLTGGYIYRKTTSSGRYSWYTHTEWFPQL
jgi:hypothetical protein